MKAVLLSVLLATLGACHNQTTCKPVCGVGFQCSLGACQPDPLGLWAVTIVNGTISQRDRDSEAWDVGGGLPDPKVCLTIGGQRTCTYVADDTVTPIWNKSLPPMTASVLLSTITVEIWDDDNLSNDPICGRSEAFITKQELARGLWRVGCPFGSIDVALVPHVLQAGVPSGQRQ